MKTLAIVLVGGGAAKIAADGLVGCWLLRLYIRPKGRTQKKRVCPSTPVEAAWKDEESGLLLPCCVALMAQFINIY